MLRVSYFPAEVIEGAKNCTLGILSFLVCAACLWEYATDPYEVRICESRTLWLCSCSHVIKELTRGLTITVTNTQERNLDQEHQGDANIIAGLASALASRSLPTFESQGGNLRNYRSHCLRSDFDDNIQVTHTLTNVESVDGDEIYGSPESPRRFALSHHFPQM